MPFTPHEIMIERCDKYLSNLYWKDVNLYSVLYSEVIRIEDKDIGVFEAPGTERPLFPSVVPKKLGPDQAEHLAIDRPIYSNVSTISSAVPKNAHSPSQSLHKGTTFLPLAERVKGRNGFGPAWSTKWFKVTVRLSKSYIRQHRHRIALRWDSQSEAMLYSSKGKAISSYTGSDGCDRRDLVYLGSTLPKLAEDVRYDSLGVSGWDDDSSDDEEDEMRSDDSPGHSNSHGKESVLVDGEVMDADSLTGTEAYTDGNETVKLVYYVEMACCGKFGNGDGGMIAAPGDRTFDLKLCEIVVVNDAAMALYWDMQVLQDIAKELPPPNQIGVQAASLTSVVINNTHLQSRTSLLQARRAIADAGVFMETKVLKDSYTQSRSNVSRFEHSESVTNSYRNGNE